MEANDQERLYAACRALIDQTLYQHTQSSDTAGFIASLLQPAGIDERIVALLGAILPNLCATWRSAEMLSKPSAPKLASVDWQVAMNDGGSSVVMQLGTEGNEGKDGVVFEMNTMEVDTLLEGLTKIKDQLRKVV
jgi:hypothetical protein